MRLFLGAGQLNVLQTLDEPENVLAGRKRDNGEQGSDGLRVR